MTQEDKDLLLKDLSARLHYNIYVYFKTRYRCNAITDVLDGAIYTYIETHLLEDDDENEIDIIKPYLRPMSSMTEEEKEELSHLLPKDWSVEIDKLNNFYFDMSPSIFMEIDVFLNIIDWLNAHHFDYRGLIEKGLALEAPEGMYNIK